MFMSQTWTQSASAADILKAAEAAARAIPPAFPLEGTVAVNSLLGQAGEDMAKAAARLGRVAGVTLTQDRAAYAGQIAEGKILAADLQAALDASASPLKPDSLDTLRAVLARQPAAPMALPTVADLALRESGIDWPAVIARSFGLWAAGHFDRGQAFWTPAPGLGAYASWRAWATNDMTPEIAGLRGFCSHVAAAPDTADRAILRATTTLGLAGEGAETALHRLLMDLGGWSQHARWLLWQAELSGKTDATLTDMLAIRLIWEEAILAQYPEVTEAWLATVAAHAEPIAPTQDQVIDTILQTAAEHAYQRQLISLLGAPKRPEKRPAVQAAFCIDVRSEVFRRAFEAQAPDIQTIGFAGFFGLPLSHKSRGSDIEEAHLPVLLAPTMHSTSQADEKTEQDVRIAARARRAWGRFRQAAVSSFAFVEAAGPLYGWKLVKDAFGLGAPGLKPEPAPQIVGGLTAAQKTNIASAVLRAMSLTKGHARLVLLLGHGAHVTNNPHASAYQCGACAGQTGEVSARVLAALLNDPDTRAGLLEQGIELPEDTLFIAGLHDTVTDTVTLHTDAEHGAHGPDIAQAMGWLKAAGSMARAERALRLPGATSESLARRAVNWAEVRPEWGLAGCASFIAAPRSVTAGADLGGRTFLHTYDWKQDKGFSTLELILTAPVVVASWINLQYYCSAVAPDTFGGGNKLIHNVVGGIGVVQGNGGTLRPGLPWQTIHDGEQLMHEPLRLTVMIEAPKAAILDVLDRHAEVRALFDNTWLHLFAIEDGKVNGRYLAGLAWADEMKADRAA